MAQEKVLIVEDEENERTGLAELVRAWGYDTETASDGVEGLERAESWNPGIVITDLKMPRMGGLWVAVPRMGGVWLFFAMASLGLPGMGNFIGEFLILLGTYQVSVVMAVLAALGLVVSTVYAVWMAQKVFFGANGQGWRIPDLEAREMTMMVAMMVVILWLGLYPQPYLDTARDSLVSLHKIAGTASTGSSIKMFGRQQ